jgi:hypothetical protein
VTDLEQRYRGPSRAYRVVALVLVAALGLTSVGLLGWTVFFHSNPQVQSGLAGFAFNGEHEATADIAVNRESTTTEVFCKLQAIAADHSVVGELTHPVVDGPREQVLRVTIRTERRATSIDLVGCTTAEDPRPR